MCNSLKTLSLIAFFLASSLSAGFAEARTQNYKRNFLAPSPQDPNVAFNVYRVMQIAGHTIVEAQKACEKSPPNGTVASTADATKGTIQHLHVQTRFPEESWYSTWCTAERQ